ncbi:MAG: hypothetical protein EB060_12835, partial [Proteobacteria bacterium]|nr:hypothetical protein [Pseudomonadota bacterium]
MAWDGFAPGDGPADLAAVAFTYGGATPGAADGSGTYPLGIAGLTAANYALGTVMPGTLTVRAAPTPPPPTPAPVTPLPPAPVTPEPVPPAPTPAADLAAIPDP